MDTGRFHSIADTLDNLGKTVRDHSSRGGMLRDDTQSVADMLHEAAMLVRTATTLAVEEYARAYSGRAKREDAA